MWSTSTTYVEEWNRHQTNTDDSHRLRTNLVPDPFTGPFDAELVLLNRNPGVGETDARQHRSPLFRDIFRRSLIEGTDRHLYLTEAFKHTDGGHRWRSCVKGLTESGPCLELDHVATRTLSVDFHGYHSSRWRPLPITLPSQLFGFELVRNAMARGSVIVVFRGVRDWCVAVPGLDRYRGLVKGKNPQVASISARNLGDKGFRKIVNAVC